MLDQFEEYFLYATSEEDGDGFGHQLIQAVNNPTLRVNFLLSLREDALARLDHFKGRIPFLFDNRLSLEPLDRSAGYSAVTRPLAKYNADHGTAYEVEPALVDEVLDQVARGRVALARQGAGLAAPDAPNGRIETPYLQLVLTRLWEEETAAGATLLRAATLAGLGGAERIVSNYLNDTMTGLKPEDRVLAARFFDRLVTLGGAKIALSQDELAGYTRADATAVQSVINQLEGKRLLRSVQSPAGVTQYEIFHDVLGPAILDWQGRYQEAQEEAERLRQEQDARAEAERRAAEAAERAESERRNNARLRWLLGLTGLLLVAALAAVVVAWNANRAAETQRAAAVAAEERAEARRIEAEDAARAAQAAQATAEAQKMRADRSASEAEAEKQRADERAAAADRATRQVLAENLAGQPSCSSIAMGSLTTKRSSWPAMQC